MRVFSIKLTAWPVSTTKQGVFAQEQDWIRDSRLRMPECRLGSGVDLSVQAVFVLGSPLQDLGMKKSDLDMRANKAQFAVLESRRCKPP